MKITLALERYNPLGGGLEQWAAQLVDWLADRGHRITVVAFQADQWAAQSPSVSIHLLPWQESRLARATAMDQACAQIEADVVHDLGVGTGARILHPQMGCRLANYRQELKSLGSLQRLVRSLHPHQRQWLSELTELEHKQYRASAGTIVAVSNMVARDLAALHRVPMDRMRIIPNGVHPRRFSPHTPEAAATRAAIRQRFQLSDDVVFLFAAHNPRLKGIAPLIEAFESCVRKRRGTRLLVIGKEPTPALLRLVRKHRAEESVVFAGFVPDARPYFAAADAFVLPTYYDACSLTVLEACASGLPVVTTRQNGASELLDDGREGRILNHAQDVSALSDALVELTDSDVRSGMGGRALEAASHWTFDHNAAQIEELYCEVAQQRDRLQPAR